jgi:hypothetical protein
VDSASLGIFEYWEDSFTIDLKNGKRKICWKDIQKLEGYKRDLITIDQVCLDIILNETIITISEDTEGFGPFIEELKKQFPSIDKDWDLKVTEPPFATNLTVLFKRV